LNLNSSRRKMSPVCHEMLLFAGLTRLTYETCPPQQGHSALLVVEWYKQ
jgi:hypothetical protein